MCLQRLSYLLYLHASLDSPFLFQEGKNFSDSASYPFLSPLETFHISASYCYHYFYFSLFPLSLCAENDKIHHSYNVPFSTKSKNPSYCLD